MGTVLLLLAVPLLVFVVGELLSRFSWTLFGLSLNSRREKQPPRSRGRITRQPELPPRLSLHERGRCRIVYHEIGPGGEPPRSVLRA